MSTPSTPSDIADIVLGDIGSLEGAIDYCTKIRLPDYIEAAKILLKRKEERDALPAKIRERIEEIQNLRHTFGNSMDDFRRGQLQQINFELDFLKGLLV